MGRWSGSSPVTVDDLPPGRYRLRVDGVTGRGAVERAVTVGRTPVDLTITLPSAGRSRRVVTLPPGAWVRVDGRPVGVPTPCRIDDLTPGRHRVTVEHETHAAIDTVLTIDADPDPAEWTFIRPRVDRRRLTIDSEPPGATVRLDGRLVGDRTPLHLSDFPSGRVHVTVFRPGYTPFSRHLTIPRDGATIAPALARAA